MLPTGSAKTALLPAILGDDNNAGGGGTPIERENEGGREHKPEGTRGCTRPEVFGKDAMKKGDRNHPNSMQHGNYIIENWKIRENIIEHGRTTARPLAS